MKILIAVPCMDQVPAQFAQSLAMLQKVGDCALAFNMGSLIYTSRNELAKMAIKMEADYVFWLDSDMTFEPDTLVRMMRTMEENSLDILTGLYFRRVPPYSPVLFDQLKIRGNACQFTEFKEIPTGLFEVGACGFGCVLMKTDPFIDVQARHGNCFAPIANNGEDVAFCWRARNCGYKIYCDPSIKLGHVGKIIITEDFYKSFHGAKSGG